MYSPKSLCVSNVCDWAGSKVIAGSAVRGWALVWTEEPYLGSSNRGAIDRYNCKRERERERERGGGRKRTMFKKEQDAATSPSNICLNCVVVIIICILIEIQFSSLVSAVTEA